MSSVVYRLKEYEKTKPRLLKGDLSRLKQICVQLDKITIKEDGFCKYGINKATSADAIKAAFDCFFNMNVEDQITLLHEAK